MDHDNTLRLRRIPFVQLYSDSFGHIVLFYCTRAQPITVQARLGRFELSIGIYIRPSGFLRWSRRFASIWHEEATFEDGKTWAAVGTTGHEARFLVI